MSRWVDPQHKTNYWNARRANQWKRFGGRIGKAYEQKSVGSVARAAWSGVKYLRTLVNSEVHKVDFTNNGTASNTPTILNLTGIAQGDGIADRSGNSILVSYLSVRLWLSMNALASNSVIRVIVFCDKQQIADTAPTAADVLSVSSNVLSHYNATKVGRFQIIADKCLKMNLASANQSQVIKIARKWNKHMRYNGTAATDIEKGGLYVLVMSNEPVNTVAFAYSIRLGYHDN